MAARTKREPVSDFNRRRVIHEAGNRCSFCAQDDIAILQPHHIEDAARGGKSDLANLIAVCPTCHSKITSGIIPRGTVLEAKRAQPVAPHRVPPSAPSGSAVIVQGPVNGGVVAGRDVVYKTTGRKLPPRAALANSLATELNKINYCKYLIRQYHILKAWHVGKEQMRYAVIHATVKRHFKAALSDIPLHRFDEVVEFLQRKILGTVVGRGRNAHGQALFESFEEYTARHG